MGIPNRLHFLHPAAKISTGWEHTLILKTDGSLYSFGKNNNGQLGDGTYTDRHSPILIIASGVEQIAAGESHSLVLKTDGSLFSFGNNDYGQLGDGTTNNKNSPTQILASGVAKITAGKSHSLIIKTDGSLHTFGSNYHGQLGDGTTTDRHTPTQILYRIVKLEVISLPNSENGSPFIWENHVVNLDGTSTVRQHRLKSYLRIVQVLPVHHSF